MAASSFPVLAVFLALAADPLSAQIAYQPGSIISASQRALPNSGPGSAFRNPAAQGETVRLHLRYGTFQTLSGKAGRHFYLASVTPTGFLRNPLPVRASAGLSMMRDGSEIDNSNAVYQITDLAPALAITLPLMGDPMQFIGLGIAFPSRTYDAFGTVESSTSSMDAGLLAKFLAGGHAFRFSFAWFNLREPKVEMPDSRGNYQVNGWTETGVEWGSPSRAYRAWCEWFVDEIPPSREGADPDRAGLNGWGFEYRPRPWLGLSLERPRFGSLSSIGIGIHPVVGPHQALIDVELNLGHDKFDSPMPGFLARNLFGGFEDEGRGYQLGLSVAVGI